MSQEKIVSALSIAIQTGVPVLIWGAPGVGKTATVTAVAKSLKLPVEVVLASIREPSDFAGLPVIREDGVRMEPPAWAKRLAQAGEGILFLDEISTAPPAVQAALLRVVLDRVVGDLPLPAGVSVVAAANPPEQAAGGWDLSAPLANRFCHLNWTVDARVWVNGMLQGWPEPVIKKLPAEWEVHIPATRALVASFIQTRPHLLLQVPQNETQAGRAWPSPRSWDMGARLLAACTAAKADDDMKILLLGGCVGEGPALEFYSWQKSLDLPDPEELLQNPKKFILPERGDQAYAVLTAVVSATIQNPTEERWLAAWRIMGKAAEQGAKDIAAVAARTLGIYFRNNPGRNLPVPPVRELELFKPVLVREEVKI